MTEECLAVPEQHNASIHSSMLVIVSDLNLDFDMKSHAQAEIVQSRVCPGSKHDCHYA
jgi:hypothetical protein